MDPEQEREGSTNDIVYLKDERNNTFTLAVMIREKKKSQRLGGKRLTGVKTQASERIETGH